MAKLYFKYGAMGSSKTAQALITKYNYEENDLRVWLLKPSADLRDGEHTLSSRIGLSAKADVLPPDRDAYAWFRQEHLGKCDVIIVDECQFLTVDQIDQLRAIVDDYNVPVMCFGLRTDFQRSKPSATAGPRPRSMPESMVRATLSPKVPRSSWGATTATSPCATSAISGASGKTKLSNYTITKKGMINHGTERYFGKM